MGEAFGGPLGFEEAGLCLCVYVHVRRGRGLGARCKAFKWQSGQASNETKSHSPPRGNDGMVIAFLLSSNSMHDQPCPPRIALTLVACAETRRGLLIVSALCLCPCFDCFPHFPSSFHRQPTAADF